MIYIDKKPNPSGAYPNPKNQPFPGCIALNDQQSEVFFDYNGFVTVRGGEVIPNVEAWETWKAGLSEPSDAPPADETSVWDELDAAYKEGVNSAYDE